MSSYKNSPRGILQRALAQLLAFLMVFGFTVSGLGVRNAYTTELQLGGSDNGVMEATAFQWVGPVTGASSEDDGISTMRFDVHGLDTGQTSHAIGGIQTTRSHAGYAS